MWGSRCAEWPTDDELSGDEDDDGRVGGGGRVGVEGRDLVLHLGERQVLRAPRPRVSLSCSHQIRHIG